MTSPAPNPFDLPDGCSVVIAGGLGGIGSEITRMFLGLGARVVATALTPEERNAASLPDQPELTKTLLDVTHRAQIAELADSLPEVDVLVNCAGILDRDREFDPDTFDRVINVNLGGTFNMCTAFRHRLAARNGCIVNIASMNAFTALPRLPAYCASKAGVVMLTKSLAHAWAEDGIRVNAVAPGYIETPINAEGRKDRHHAQTIAQRTALKRWGKPDEVAGTVVFLATSSARYITGSVYTVDGGFLAG